MAEWAALGVHLRELGHTVTLTWPELAEIVGPLPSSASDHRSWWSGDRTHVREWREAGFAISQLRLGDSVTFSRIDDAVEPIRAAGDSTEQRRVEALMLDLLGKRRGIQLAPRRLTSPGGAYVDVDGVSEDASVLVECWAHRGPAKVAQKYKLVNDAAKLHWAAGWLSPAPSELLLCVGDELAVKHLRGRSWQGEAIRQMKVEIEVVELTAEGVDALLRAQRRQFR